MKRLLFISLLFLVGSACSAQQWTIYNTTNSGIPDDWVWGLDIDTNQNAWIGTVDLGLAKFDGINWIVYNTANSNIPHNTCFVTAFESNGDIWVGTLVGVSGFDGVNWTNPIGADVWDIAIDSNNYKWVTTLGYGLAVYDNANWSYYDINSGLATNIVYAIEIDSSGIKWIGTNIGLVKYDGASWTKYDINNSALPYNTVLSLEIDQDGNIWAGTGGANNEGGLAKFDGSNWTVYTDANSNLPSNCINDVLSDDEGNIWIATGGTQPGGLVKFDRDTTWVIYNNSNSDLPALDNRVQSLAIDSNGCIWTGTHDGVGVLCLDSIPNSINPRQNEPLSIYHIFPNPTSGKFTVAGATGEIQVNDLFGRLVLCTKESQIDMSSYPAGIYMVRVGEAVRKLIIQ